MVLNKLIQRENEIFTILQTLKDEKIVFVLIGGYAVSAFKQRFSVDADVVVKEENVHKITGILERRNFKNHKYMELINQYGGKFQSFIKKEQLPVTVDLLINAIASRQTNATWSFETFRTNCLEKEVVGIEKSVKVFVPIKELLIATKLHACRLTDIRDVVAICDGTDIKKIIDFTLQGDNNALREGLKKFRKILNDKNFEDSFKGVFSIYKLPLSNIAYAQTIIEALERSIK
mgnify:CR=1 FL=1